MLKRWRRKFGSAVNSSWYGSLTELLDEDKVQLTGKPTSMFIQGKIRGLMKGFLKSSLMNVIPNDRDKNPLKLND